MADSEGDADSSISVLHVAVPAPVGGLESVLRGLVLGHHRRGHRVGVVLVVEPPNRQVPLAEELHTAGVRLWIVESPPRSYLRERRAVVRAIRSFEPEVLHTHGYRPDILDSGLGGRHGLGLVTTVHGSSRMGGLSRLFEWVQSWTFHRFDAVVAVSDAIAQYLQKRWIPEERIHVIPNGLYPEVSFLSRSRARKRLDIPEGVFVVGWLGRLIPAKGPDLFLEALANVEGDGLRASIIGDGPMKDQLLARVVELGLDGQVEFHGMISDAARFFKAFDVFTLSSRTEGTPLVLLEAMAAEVPIVCTAVGGVPDVVGGGAAWIVPPRETMALAAAIDDVRDSADLASTRTDTARARLRDRYSGDVWLSQYEDVYRHVSRTRSD